MGEFVRKTIILSAGSAGDLAGKCSSLAALFQASDGAAAYDSVKTRALPLNPSHHRAGFVWESRAAAIASLEGLASELGKGRCGDDWTDGTGFYRTRGIDPGRQRLAGIFSGQGALYANMGKRLLAAFPIFEQGFSHMDDIMARSGLSHISDLLFPGADLSKSALRECRRLLHKTEYTQPAIGVFAACLYRILEALGFSPAMVGGLSFGEILALWAGRVVSDAAFFKVVHIRGMAMALELENARGKGAMMAVSGDGVSRITQWVDLIPDIVVESWNSKTQLVLSGLRFRLEGFQFFLQENGFDAFILPVSGAFHSPFMETAHQAFTDSMKPFDVSSPEISVYSNMTAWPYPADDGSIRKMMADHILRPVRFSEMIENMYDQGGYTFVEFGPKRLLSGLINDILDGRPHIAVPMNNGNRRQTRYRLKSPVRVTAVFEGHPPVACIAGNVSKDGLQIRGLPKVLYEDRDQVDLCFDGGGHRHRISARLMWRQGRCGGLKIEDEAWGRDIFPALIQGLPPASATKPDKDSDRQLREAVMKLIVLGYDLTPLDALLSGGPDTPLFNFEGSGSEGPGMPEEWRRQYWLEDREPDRDQGPASIAPESSPEPPNRL